MFSFFRQRKNKPEHSPDDLLVSESAECTDHRLIAVITAAVLSYRSLTNRKNASNFVVKRIRRI